ncbi:MAG TPA: ATPase domain-containing protein [Kofleriaceae bacterium]|nr:ATPase domain-containing protein [Kofleriaceae bacterium]
MERSSSPPRGADDRAATGIAGLDLILNGGLPRDRLYLVEGDPGVGKTTVALQFLLTGAALGERGLYISLSETVDEIRQIASSHGWSMDPLAMFELSALEQQLRLESQNTIFRASDVELTETTRALLEFVDKVRPDRVVFDSLSELRLLAQSALRYRREVLNLKQYFSGKHSTVLLLDDRTSEPGDMQLQSLVHGVLSMQHLAPDYGGDRRRLRISKLRGATHMSGYHDFVIHRGGVEVFPRLVASEHHASYERTALSSGVPALDAMLGGGLTRGTSTLLMGPAGTGKSILTSLYATAAARRGEKSLILAFDELRRTTIERGDALGMGMSEHVAAGRIKVQQVDPAELSPGELGHLLREQVEVHGISLVVVDSLNGYLQAMPAEQYLNLQLHELLTYFGQRGVTTILVMAQYGVAGTYGPAEVSYIADSVLLLRYFEAGGHVRKAISVIKKRTGAHEDSIRELTVGAGGVTIGEPLAGFRGVLPNTLGLAGDGGRPDGG